MRSAQVTRQTKETQIQLSISLDGGPVSVQTGIGFFDHMLTAFAVHGGFGLQIQVQGDLEVDGHHTVEDTGIVLGQAFSKALGGDLRIERYGSFFIPMDEALAFCCCDISGRPYLVFEGNFREERVGAFDTCLTREFFRAFAVHSGITLHIKAEYGDNAHHIIEAMFKAAGHALKIACAKRQDLLSTKGVLDSGHTTRD